MSNPVSVSTFESADWSGALPAHACDSLEQGAVLRFPQLRFALGPDERALIVGGLSVWRTKNISLDPATGRLSGAVPGEPGEVLLQGMMGRFADVARALVLAIAPDYRVALTTGRTSFRPVEIAGRANPDWRSDDTRLHIDAFPATPTGGARILRVFANVDPQGRPRIWRLGGSFEAMAARYLPRIRPPLPGSAALLHASGRTRTRRSPYDHYMLRLHDMAKSDPAYQAGQPQSEIAFGPGVWVVFSDQVPHAAMAGCNALETTFYLPPGAQRHPALSPLKVLERMTRRCLAGARDCLP